jgi:Helix-turn-helix domain
MTIDLITKQDMDSLHVKVDKLINLLETKPSSSNSKWLKSSDVKKLLGCSDSSLINYRISGILPYTKIGGTYYYSENDVSNIFQNSTKQN